MLCWLLDVNVMVLKVEFEDFLEIIGLLVVLVL